VSPLVHIGRLYNIRAANHLRKIYASVDMYEEADNPDMVDNSGYLGLFYREKRTLLPLKEAELLQIISASNKLAVIFRIIKDIDKDNNGYVTNQELDDIFKVSYEKELGGRDLKPLFKRFASIQNRILIDYKRLKDYLMGKVQEVASSAIDGPGEVLNAEALEKIEGMSTYSRAKSVMGGSRASQSGIRRRPGLSQMNLGRLGSLKEASVNGENDY
jgi:hypothetical protein